MNPALDERTAPDAPSGAVPFHLDHATTPPPLRERDFWRAVAASALDALRPWLR
jgi:hypothetical protein